jgi:hypothetical protein
MSGGVYTDSFGFNSYAHTNNTTTYSICLGEFRGKSGGGDNLQLEIYFHANGFSQTTAANAANHCSPSKLTVMLDILNADTSTGYGINITGYAIQYGYFPGVMKLIARQDLFYNYYIFIQMNANGNPVTHATTTGEWIPANTVTTNSSWGATYPPLTRYVTDYQIPIQYVFQGGVIQTPNGFNISSSARYKTNIQDLPEHYNLDMVMKMKPITYQKKNEPGNETIYPGLIAEDLHDLQANLFVSYNQDNTPEALDYARINVLLIRAAQQLNEKIEKLTEGLAELEKNDCI